MSPVRWLRAVAVIGATALLMASSCSWQLGTPIPEGVPPPAGDPVPQIDTHAKGRPADQLHEWAARTGAGAGHTGHRAGGLRVCRPGRRGGESRLSSGVDDAGRHRHGGEPPRHLPRRDDRARTATSRRRSAACGWTAPWATWRSSTTTPASSTGTRTCDRAMGPMQFIPETWRLYGVDANNDGDINPDNYRRRGAVGGRLPVLARQGPRRHPGLDGRAARLQPLRAVRPNRAGLGDGIRQRTSPLTTLSGQSHALGSTSKTVQSVTPDQGDASAHHRAGRSPRDPRLPR